MPIIAAAGSFAGPCYETCDHLGCEHDRWITCQPCALCGNAIGFGYPYDIHEDASATTAEVERLGYRPFVLVHRLCFDRELQALRGEPDSIHGETATGRRTMLRSVQELWRMESDRRPIAGHEDRGHTGTVLDLPVARWAWDGDAADSITREV